MDEGRPGDPPASAAELLRGARAALEVALAALRAADPARLEDARTVRSGGAPDDGAGPLGHAEHATRHAGQVVTTARVVRGLGTKVDDRAEKAAP